MEESGFDYINVIPLVDVMLVLLTIVLTTSTFIAKGSIPMELPKASKSSAGTIKTQIIEIDREGKLYLNSTLIPRGGLNAAIKGIDREVPVLIRADKGIALQIFVDVMDALKNLGFKKISLQTEEKG